MNILITGANRGIGFEFVKQFLLDQTNKVFACCCHPREARGLQSLQVSYPKSLLVLQLDVTSSRDLRDLQGTVGDIPIDILINNAGVYRNHQGLFGIDYNDMFYSYDVNTMGPVRVCEALYHNILLSHKKYIVTISSISGSISSIKASNRSYSYRASKAALNAIMKSMHLDYPALKIILLHPGAVRTGMSGPDADISVTESVSGMISVMFEKYGQFGFYDYQGNELPW